MTLQSEPKFIFTDSKAAPWLDSKVASSLSDWDFRASA